MKCNIDNDFALDYFKLYFEKKWRCEICENLRIGYNQMSKINLDLAEFGLQSDLEDLYFYEMQLVGREIL
nr:hypothetical protein [Tissierella sp.]